MWAFKGKYTGGARTYIKTKKKKQGIVLSIAFSVFYLLVFAGLAMALSGENLTFSRNSRIIYIDRKKYLPLST